MKRNLHVVVPEDKFKILEGEDLLTTYTFNTGVAKHTFCKVCGVQPFYRPRSNPDGVGVTVHCITSDTISSLETRFFDGERWEDFIDKSGIQEFSKKK